MKVEIQNLEELFCPHCFCIDTMIQTGDEITKTTPNGAWSKPIYTPHKKCCNCGRTKAVKK